ncbi:hypothetical protein FG002_020735 [Chitinimonas sp. BJB300]|nr:hypothetical protein FG002_020735 [Chitinimonas sp. BJB300]
MHAVLHPFIFSAAILFPSILRTTTGLGFSHPSPIFCDRTSLHVLAYNMKRVMKIIRNQALMNATQA